MTETYIQGRIVANALGVKMATLQKWIEAGEFPGATYRYGKPRLGWVLPLSEILRVAGVEAPRVAAALGVSDGNGQDAVSVRLGTHIVPTPE